MAFNYRLHPEAQQEYIESYLWYESKREGLGERFATLVRNKLNDITIAPETYAPDKDGFRQVKLDTSFPFVLVYKIDPQQNLIVVTAIFHTNRNPVKKYRK